jgi:hypothetical protein
MGIFEKIFGKKDGGAAQLAREQFRLLDGYTPAFRTWQGSIFESELIRAAIDAHGRHAAKLMPTIQGTAKPNLRSRLMNEPNQFQTWPQFLYRTTVILYARNTAFVVPVIGEYGETTGLISIAPDSWELVEYQGEPYIRFFFDGGWKRRAVELSRVGILTRYQYRSELFGEDNDALRATLDLIAIQRQGVQEAIKNGASFRFMAVSSNWSKDEDLAKERQRFDRENFSGESGGVLLFPNTYKDVKQISSSAYSVDAGQLKLITDNVYNYYGVNEKILQNSAIGDEWLAFYEGAIEWLAINLSDSITRMLYSERERTFGNRITFTSNRLQYMSNNDKLRVASQMADRGLMTRNEIREIFNLPPLPEPIGSQLPARGEYYNVNDETEDETDADQNV